MIVGIGNDILETKRIEEAAKRHGFLDRYFTEKEIMLFREKHMRAETIGGNFSVKEAVSKALGTGIRHFGLKDIEVLRDRLGKPYIKLYGLAEKLAKERDIDAWHVSISHNKSHITAIAIGERYDHSNL